MKLERIEELVSPYGLKADFVQDGNEAIALAKSKATKNDMIYIGGSTFVVAEIEAL